MADFNVELSSPQGGATQVVAPIQVQPVPEFNANQAIAQGVNIFGDYLHNKAKAEADVQKNSILGDYAQSEDRIAQAVRSGGITATEGLTHSRKNYAKFIAAAPGMHKDIDSMRKGIYEGGEMGAIETEVKDNKARDERGNLLAESYGMPTYAHTSPATQVAQREAAYIMKQEEVRWKRDTERKVEGRAQSAEGRASTSFNNQMADRQTTDDATASLLSIVKTNYSAYLSALQDEVNFVQSSKNPAVDSLAAQGRIMARMSDISVQATAAAGGRDQNLVEPYLRSFNEITKVTMEMTKPGADVDALKQQVEKLRLTAQLTFLQKPNVAAAVAGSSLLPNSAPAVLLATDEVHAAVADVTKKLTADPLYTHPNIVGNPRLESASLDIIRGGLETLQKDKDIFGDKAKLTAECQNSVNSCLRQTEAIVQQGATPAALSKIAAFYASPEFGKASSSGILDNQALNGATQAFVIYNKTVVNSVENELATKTEAGRGKGVPVPMADIVDLNFSGSKVQFAPLDKSIRSAESAKTMQKSADALTHLVYIGAHLSGTQDYAKYWETSKHRILPSLYADPEKFPPGFVNPKNGWKFKGGVFYNANNWEKPKDVAK